jgi:hypothetical protein
LVEFKKMFKDTFKRKDERQKIRFFFENEFFYIFLFSRRNHFICFFSISFLEFLTFLFIIFSQVSGTLLLVSHSAAGLNRLNPQKIVFSTFNRFIRFKLRISTSKVIRKEDKTELLLKWKKKKSYVFCYLVIFFYYHWFLFLTWYI